MEVDREAGGRDRRRAAARIRDAAAAGRIVQADADLRLTQVEAATMVSDLDRLVRDLADRPAPRSGAPTPASTSPSTPRPTQPTRPTRPTEQLLRRDSAGASRPRRRTGGPARRLVPWVVAIVGFLGVRGAIDAAFDDDGAAESSVVLRGSPTAADLREVREAVRARTGGTEVIGLALHPGHADLVLPEGKRGARGTLARYDAAGFDPIGDPQPWGERRLDLALVEPRAVTVAVRAAEAELADPVKTVVRFGSGPRGPLLTASADDADGTRVVATVTFDGRVRSVDDRS